jgi:hypothetical protein
MIKYIIEIYLKMQLQFHSAVFQQVNEKADRNAGNLLISVFDLGDISKILMTERLGA